MARRDREPPPHRLVLLACLAATLGGCGVGEEEPPAWRPHLVLVSIDSLRADRLGCYGHGRDTSPRIDRLAAEGVRFAEAVSTTSWTLPAHAALFTGLLDQTHGVVDNGLALAPAHVTLAELLASRGYHTAGFFGGPYLHPTFGLAQGFEVYRSCMTTTPDDAPPEAVRSGAQAKDAAAHRDVTGPRTVDEVERWLSARDAAGDARPFLCFLHLWDVHYDYLPPAELVERFDPGYAGFVTGRDVMGDPRIAADMPARDREHLLALYDAEVRATDDVLGRVLDALAARGLLEDAVVFVTADHGEEFFEHGGKGHQRTLFDEVLRVPLIVWAGESARAELARARTGVGAGVVVAEQVRLVDLLPTLARLAGIEEPLAVQGRDLGPALRGEELAPVPALAGLAVNDEALVALRTREEKLVRDAKRGLAARFDLTHDPGEASPRPLADARALEEAVRAALRFERLLATRPPQELTPDPAIEAALRDLGYLGR